MLQFVSHYKGLSRDPHQYLCHGSILHHLPKIVFLDGSDGVNRSHVGLDPKNFQAQTGSFLDHLVCMVGILGRHGVRFPLDVGRNVLVDALATRLESAAEPATHTFRAMKTERGPARVKIPVGLTEVTMASTCNRSQLGIQ